MRHVQATAVVLLCAVLGAAAPPVVVRVDSPVKEQKGVVSDPHGWGTYQDARAASASGKTVLLAVGVRDRKVGYWVEELPGWKPGVYKCYKGEDGEPKIETTPHAPPVVTMPNQAPKADGHDHSCPRCGRDQYVQDGSHADGSHTHTCPSCGTSWRHGGALGYPGTRGGAKPDAPPRVVSQYQQPRQSYLPQLQFGLSAPGLQLNGCVGGG